MSEIMGWLVGETGLSSGVVTLHCLSPLFLWESLRHNACLIVAFSADNKLCYRSQLCSRDHQLVIPVFITRKMPLLKQGQRKKRNLLKEIGKIS